MSKANVKFFSNDEGVSPIVATLVLIVVAIVGAAAVGLIMGSFSSNVSKQANSGDTAAGASTTILVAGSTTCQPIIQTMANMYMGNHTGVKITVQGGGSGAGLQSAGSDIVDIGMSSEYTPITTAQAAAYPNLKAQQIGGSGVVVIMNGQAPAATGNGPTFAELVAMYTSTGTTLTVPAELPAATSEAVYRSDASGTQDTFFSAISGGAGVTVGSSTKLVAESGNGAVVTEVATGTAAAPKVGFADLDAVWNKVGTAAGQVQIVPVTDGATNNYAGATTQAGANTIRGKIKAQLINGASTGSSWYATRGLWFLTNGAPDTFVQPFITYVESPGAQAYFNSAGLTHISEIHV